MTDSQPSQPYSNFEDLVQPSSGMLGMSMHANAIAVVRWPSWLAYMNAGHGPVREQLCKLLYFTKFLHQPSSCGLIDICRLGTTSTACKQFEQGTTAHSTRSHTCKQPSQTFQDATATTVSRTAVCRPMTDDGVKAGAAQWPAWRPSASGFCGACT